VTAWPPRCYQRATAFVTDPAHRLLVFDHIDDPSVPTQVPAGGIKPGEPAEVAVQRELGARQSASSSVRHGSKSLLVAKKGKKEKPGLGPRTIVKPCLIGAGALFVIQTAMKVFLKA
jgi:hypothetical protein